MATLEIDGIGKVEIDDAFLKLSPEQQATEVDAIAAQIKGGGTGEVPYASSEEEVSTLAAVTGGQPKPDALAARGSLLPVGRTKEGDLTMALPAFLEGPRQTIMDLIDGKRTASQISGKEMFELGSLFAGAGGASGRLGLTGTGKGAPAAAAAVPAVADDAARAAVPEIPAGAVPAVADDALRAAAPEAPPAVEPTATTAEFKTAAKSYYKQMEDAGVMVAPGGTKRLSTELKAAAEDAAIDPTLHPRGTAALKRVQDAADKPLSFERLDQLRQIVKEAGSSPDPGERRIAGILTDKLDDFVEKLGGSEVAAGDAAKAKTSIVLAQNLWSKVRKLETVEDLVERARISASGFSASGFENALRTEFRALAKSKSKMRTFSANEQKGIKKVAIGTMRSKAARGAGKLAPTGVVSGALGGGIGAAVGTAIGIGPIAGAAAAGGLGFTGRALATAMAKRYVRELENTIRTNGNSKMASSSLARAKATLQALGDEAAQQAPRAATTSAADARSR